MVKQVGISCTSCLYFKLSELKCLLLARSFMGVFVPVTVISRDSHKAVHGADLGQREASRLLRNPQIVLSHTETSQRDKQTTKERY